MKPFNFKSRIIALLFSVIIPFCSVAKEPTIVKRTDKDKMNSWVEFVFSALTPREKIAQLMIPMIFPNGSEITEGNINRYVKQDKVGGLLVSRGTIKGHAELINKAQSLSSTPLLMCIDGEWGSAMRMTDAIPFPKNMILGAITDDKLLYEYGQEVARQCRLMGIHVDFAPVLDVNTNPANPVIGYRSFGELPEMVGRKGVAYSKGLEDGGVLSVAKHFPGHGSTQDDSHKTLPVINKSKAELEVLDIVPFKRYINAGLGGVLVGHLDMSTLDNSGVPASLNPSIVDTWLHKKLKFTGLTFTDALGMKGAAGNGSTCVKALKAGNDVLLCPNDISKEINAIEDAIKSGEISQDLINEKCRKMLKYKYILGAHIPHTIDEAKATEMVNSASTKAMISKLWSASMTVFKDDKHTLPIKSLAKVKIGLCNVSPSIKEFVTMCKLYAPVSIIESTDIGNHDYVIFPVVTNDDLSYQALNKAVASGKDVIAVFFINPYKVSRFADILNKNNVSAVIAYDDCNMAQSYAAQLIFGGIGAKGKLPVTIEGVAKAETGINYEPLRLGYSQPEEEGVSSRLVTFVDSIAEVGIRTKAFPGCQVLMAKGGKIILNKNYGYTDSTKRNPIDCFTLYDLASVSKATGTLSGIMKACDDGLIDVNEKISKYISELKGTDKENILVKELLFHESAMEPTLNVFNAMIDQASYTPPLFSRQKDALHSIVIDEKTYGSNSARLRTDILSYNKSAKFPIEICRGIYGNKSTYDTLMQRIYKLKLRPTKKYTYSCLNFCLLMNIEQNVTHQLHNDYVDDNIFAPLGAYHCTYRPLEKFSLNQIAPTESDKMLRKQFIHGYVHDELAGFSGGVQGNAGLFSNANDLAKFCQLLLNRGEYGGERLLSSKTVNKFLKMKSATCRRGLGFDKPDKTNEDNSPTCASATAETVGHLGFTGTCFWIDPKNDMIFIFLCNRVYPSRNNEAFSKLDIRPRLFQGFYDNLLK